MTTAGPLPVPSLALPRIGRQHHAARVAALVRLASQWFCVPAEEITGPRRVEDAVLARWCVWTVLAREGWPVARIARVCGRDHSTVINGLRRYGDAMRYERELVDAVAYLEAVVAAKEACRGDA